MFLMTWCIQIDQNLIMASPIRTCVKYNFELAANFIFSIMGGYINVLTHVCTIFKNSFFRTEEI